MATEIPMLEDVTLFRWLSRGGTAIISVTGRRDGRREVVHLTIEGGQVSALTVEARESSDEAERSRGGRRTSGIKSRSRTIPTSTVRSRWACCTRA
jgi:hypothetical protein